MNNQKSQKTLLIVAHIPSKNTKSLAQAVSIGANSHELPIQVILQSPQDTISADVLNADAIILGTTENLGYMAGLTKDFFDRCYYDLVDKKQGMAYAVYIRAGHDGTGTKKALEIINNGLRWNLVQEPLILQGAWSDGFIEEVQELGMAMVAGLEMGIF